MLLTVLGVAASLVLVAAAAVVVVIRGPLPKHSGEVTLSGPRAEIRVLRDDRAVPHIYATTDHDLFFAQGYVHAQERFFQMDLWRHTASGRLAELVGE
ncbi:MAG: penicillin acylase family protein, partial [Arachnia propionica]